MVNGAPEENVRPVGLLAIESTMSPDEALGRLQINALAVHQRSMGRGDELIRILSETVRQLQRTHARVETISTILFAAGLLSFAVGVGAVVAGRNEVWGTLIGGLGGTAAFAAVFWTGPVERISTSVADLVKLETAFLGYIRVIGEIDSFFQMQYLDIISETGNGAGKTSLAQAIQNTTTQMQNIMSTTVTLIDDHMSLSSDSLAELRKTLDETRERLRKLEATGAAAKQ